MPTRDVLSPSQRPQFTEIPADMPERDVIRYYTFSDEDLAVIHHRRRDHNRLGFAVQLAFLRFPGRPLRSGEHLPQPILHYIASQLRVSPDTFQTYAQRDTTRREHVQEIIQHFQFQPFSRHQYRDLALWLLPTALSTDSGVALVTALIEEMRTRKIVAPALYVVERLAWETRRRAQRQIFAKLTLDLTPVQEEALDQLLTVLPERTQTQLAWLRQPPGKPAPATILKLLERLVFIRSLGLDPLLTRQIHQNYLLKLAREGARYSPHFLQRFTPTQRYATLVAFLLETAATLTDHVIDLHDRLMTQYFRRSEQAHAERFHTSGKAINEKVRLYAAVGKALIAAREAANDPYKAIQTVLPWETFVQTVSEADQLAQPPDFDYLDHLDAFYGQIRKYAPAMLDSLQFYGAPVCQPLLRAIHLLKQIIRKIVRRCNQAHRSASSSPGGKTTYVQRKGSTGTIMNCVPCMNSARRSAPAIFGLRAVASSKPLMRIYCRLQPGSTCARLTISRLPFPRMLRCISQNNGRSCMIN